MNDSQKLILIAGGLYLVLAIAGFVFGISFNKPKQIYAILAYLVIFQFFVVLLLVEPLVNMNLTCKVIMLTVTGLIISGQLLNDSRKFYPFTSWMMYSSGFPGGTVLLLETENENGEIRELKSGEFSPARSSRPHAQLFSMIAGKRNSEPEEFNDIMNYYCSITESKEWKAEYLHVREIRYNSSGLTGDSDLIASFKCSVP